MGNLVELLPSCLCGSACRSSAESRKQGFNQDFIVTGVLPQR